MFFTEGMKATSLAISSFLSGIAFSGLYFSKKIPKKYRLSFVGILQIISAVYGFFVLRNFQLISSIIILENPIIKFSILFLYLFVPAFLLGGGFPLINSICVEKIPEKHSITGYVYFWDTIGAILGSLVAGFYLIPIRGIEFTIIVNLVTNLLLALYIIKNKYLKVFIWGILIAIPLVKYEQKIDPVTQEDKLNNVSLKHTKFGEVIFQKNSFYGQITVGVDAFGKNGNKALFINYRDMCNSLMNQSEKLLAYYTVREIPDKAEVINIGLGCGYTANEIAKASNVESLNIVEINPVIIEGFNKHFLSENKYLSLSKVKIKEQDGVELINTLDHRVDSIIIDIEEVSVVYSSPLYTVEYFRLIKNHLKDNGVLGLWSLNFSPKFSKIIYNTLKNVFPNVEFRIFEGNIIFLASTKSLIKDHLTAKQLEDHKKILDESTDEINSLTHPNLEKNYNSNQAFLLPTDYKEDFVRSVN